MMFIFVVDIEQDNEEREEKTSDFIWSMRRLNRLPLQALIFLFFLQYDFAIIVTETPRIMYKFHPRKAVIGNILVRRGIREPIHVLSKTN